jgi:hypothetical protein
LEDLGLGVSQGEFSDPVWIDLLSGRVYDIDAALWEAKDAGTTLSKLPVYDSVVVIAERAWSRDRMEGSRKVD